MPECSYIPETHEYTSEEIEFIKQNIDSIIAEVGVKLTDAAKYTALDTVINFGGEFDCLPIRERMITQIQLLVVELFVQMDENNNTYGMPSEKDDVYDFDYVLSPKELLTIRDNSTRETFTQYIVDMKNDETIAVRITAQKELFKPITIL